MSRQVSCLQKKRRRRRNRTIHLAFELQIINNCSQVIDISHQCKTISTYLIHCSAGCCVHVLSSSKRASLFVAVIIVLLLLIHVSCSYLSQSIRHAYDCSFTNDDSNIPCTNGYRPRHESTLLTLYWLLSRGPPDNGSYVSRLATKNSDRTRYNTVS